MTLGQTPAPLMLLFIVNCLSSFLFLQTSVT